VTPRITNNLGLPEPLVRAITWSDRNREGCDYTITELLRPPRMAQLELQYADQITEDASDRIWMLLGSAGHEVLRRSADKSRIVEERAIVEVAGFKVGGQIDYSESDKCIWDYKIVSIWAAKEGPKDEWIAQLNCYKWLAKQYGVEIQALKIVCIYRDWSKPKASREEGYPQAGVEVFELPIWRDEETERFIKFRININEAAKTLEAFCTPEEMWERPEVWAVKKPGGKRAIKLYATQEEAENHVRVAAISLDIEQRPAERPRCENYCRVAKFCRVWQDFKHANQKD